MPFTFQSALLAMQGTGGRADGALHLEMRNLADETQGEVLREWPVDSGASKRGFVVVGTPEGANLINQVPYTFFVQHGLADSLIQTAIKRRETNTVQRLEREITFILEEG